MPGQPSVGTLTLMSLRVLGYPCGALLLDLRCLQLGLPRRSPRPERRATGGPSVQLSEWVAGGSGDAQGGKTRGREGGRGRMTSEIQGWKYEVRREDLP